MSDQNFAPQYVTLDNDLTAALYVRGEKPGDPTKVFYDLDKLLDQYVSALVPQATAAALAGDTARKIYLNGILDFIKSLELSLTELRAGLLEKDDLTIDDIFNMGEN